VAGAHPCENGHLADSEYQRTIGEFGEQDTTKGGKARTLDLTPQAATVVEAWYAESRPDGDGALVFEREEGGHLTNGYVLRWFYRGLAQAGIARVGERGGRPRTFHSLRHTYARVVLEHGAELVWAQRQLGHSSVTLTADLYGRWSRAAEKSQAERLADAFAL
jgi:integrase